MRLIRSVLGTIKAIAYFAWRGFVLALQQPKTPRERAEWTHKSCAGLLKFFDIRFTVEGRFPERGMFISNHTGYLDILAYAALSPVVFCAKGEMEDWFFLGWMTKMAGTVIVDRSRGGSAERATAGMQAAAADGVPVVFFPEGTTSNGQQVLEFKTGLLAKSLEAEQPITAAYIHYTLDEDNGPDVTVEDDVCFWGEGADMWSHIFNFVALRGTHVWVRIAPQPIRFSRPDIDRKAAAEEAREAVLALIPNDNNGAIDAGEDESAVIMHQK